MKDFLIVYGAIALLLTMSAAGAWLGHSILEEISKRRRVRTNWQEFIARDEDDSREFGRRWLENYTTIGGLIDPGTIVTKADRGHQAEEAPPQEHHPLALPAPDTAERLRIWSHEFDLIEELPASAKLIAEGWVRIRIGSPTERHIRDLPADGSMVWLTVDSPRGCWIGHLVITTWQGLLVCAFDAKFLPEPEYLVPGWIWEAKRPRVAWGTCEPSYPQA